MPGPKLTVRVQRAEKLSTPIPHAALGLPRPKSKLRKTAPSSRTIAGMPERVILLKYSPRHRPAGTLAGQLMAPQKRLMLAPPLLSKYSSLISWLPAERDASPV